MSHPRKFAGEQVMRRKKLGWKMAGRVVHMGHYRRKNGDDASGVESFSNGTESPTSAFPTLPKSNQAG